MARKTLKEVAAAIIARRRRTGKSNLHVVTRGGRKQIVLRNNTSTGKRVDQVLGSTAKR